jgi:hypothetical protein
MARTSQNSRSTNRKSTNNGSFAGVMDMARESPIAAAATAAGAVAAGVFLWSKRAQISDQLNQLSEQIGEWTDTMVSDRASPELKTAGHDIKLTATKTRSPTRRARGTTASTRRNANSSATISASNSGSPIA